MHGSLGVDIFLFLSGIGCWYSLSQNVFIRGNARSDNNYNQREIRNVPESENKIIVDGRNSVDCGGGYSAVIQWFRWRFLRIVIPYTICYFILQCIKALLYQRFDIVNELYLFTTIGFWIEHKGYWYIALLIPVYILAPILYKLLDRAVNRIFVGSLIILTLLVFTSINWDVYNEVAQNILNNVQFAVKRVTNFVLGMMVAPYCKGNRPINGLKIVLLFASLFVLQLVVRRIFNIYLFCNWCLTPIMLVILCSLLTKLSYTSKIYTFITWLGLASLESYITNGSTQGIAKYIASCFPNSDIFYGHYMEYALVIVLGLAFTYIFHRWSDFIIKNLKLKG